MTFASSSCPKGAKAFLSFSSVVNLERPLMKSLGAVSGGTLLTSAPSPKTEERGDSVGKGADEEEEQKVARSIEEAAAEEEETGVEPRRRRWSSEEENAMAAG